MKIVIMIGILSVATLAPLNVGQTGCTPTFAAWNTVAWVPPTAGQQGIYVEQRSHPFLFPAVWIYEETNGLTGLQRGGIGLLGDWFPPGCDQTPLSNGDFVDLSGAPTITINPFGSVGVPCLIIDEDPINDENCGNGPDSLII